MTVGQAVLELVCVAVPVGAAAGFTLWLCVALDARDRDGDRAD